MAGSAVCSSKVAGGALLLSVQNNVLQGVTKYGEAVPHQNFSPRSLRSNQRSDWRGLIRQKLVEYFQEGNHLSEEAYSLEGF